MSVITDLSFRDGDFVLVEIAPGVFDIDVVDDAAAILQAVQLALLLPRGLNRYFPDAGWDRLQWEQTDATNEAIREIKETIRKSIVRIDYVTDCSVVYNGNDGEEAIFTVNVTTSFGSDSISFALGGLR